MPFLHKLLMPRIAEEVFVLNASCLASVISEVVEEIGRTRASLPLWILFVNIAGYERYPEEEIQWKEVHVRKLAAQEGLDLRDALGGLSAAGLLEVLGNTAEKDRRLRYKDSCQVLPFSTTLDRVPELALCVTTMASDYGYAPADVSIYVQPVIQGCQCDCEVSLPYQPANKEEVERVTNLSTLAAQEMNHLGAYYSRPYGALAEITYRDSGVSDILRKMKDILDPNDVMNSGKLYPIGS